MNRPTRRRQQIRSARSRRDRNRRSMIIAVVAAGLLLIGGYVAQQYASAPAVVQAVARDELQEELLPLADPIKPISGGHDMSILPSSPPQPQTAAEGSPTPQAQIPVVSYDFGEIPVSPPVAYLYAIQNTGTADLHLSDLVTSCGCTTAELSTSVIPPGQRADLKVVFDPGFHETVGPVTRVVWVVTNDPQQSVLEMQLQAHVLAP